MWIRKTLLLWFWKSYTNSPTSHYILKPMLVALCWKKCRTGGTPILLTWGPTTPTPTPHHTKRNTKKSSFSQYFLVCLRTSPQLIKLDPTPHLLVFAFFSPYDWWLFFMMHIRRLTKDVYPIGMKKIKRNFCTPFIHQPISGTSGKAPGGWGFYLG